MFSVRVREGQFERAAKLAGVPATYIAPALPGSANPQQKIEEVLKLALERGLQELELEQYPRSPLAAGLFGGDPPKGCEVCGRDVQQLARDAEETGNIDAFLDRERHLVVAACSECRKQMAKAG